MLKNIKEKVVYISGPMTGIADYNRPAFELAETLLKEAGAKVVLNPAVIPDGLTWEQYLKIDEGMIEVCDTILLLPGWEKSKGANQEVTWGLDKCKSFVHWIDLLSALNGGRKKEEWTSEGACPTKEDGQPRAVNLQRNKR